MGEEALCLRPEGNSGSVGAWRAVQPTGESSIESAFSLTNPCVSAWTDFFLRFREPVAPETDDGRDKRTQENEMESAGKGARLPTRSSTEPVPTHGSVDVGRPASPVETEGSSTAGLTAERGNRGNGLSPKIRKARPSGRAFSSASHCHQHNKIDPRGINRNDDDGVILKERRREIGGRVIQLYRGRAGKTPGFMWGGQSPHISYLDRGLLTGSGRGHRLITC